MSMVSELYVFPYKAGSKSAIALSDALDCYRINRDGNSRFTYGPNKAVINWGWGNSLPTEVARCKVINKPEAIAKAISKRKSFECFVDKGVNCPPFTTDILTARQWKHQGHNIYVRQQDEGSDGSGLVFHRYNDIAPIPLGRFYTNQIHGTEYRVNVCGDEIITYQKKVRRSDATNHDENIRTTNGGWGFEVVENERSIPSCVDDECILAIEALGLDFGGVDVIVTNGGAKAYVLEVNTAPHLTPYSARKMAEALKEYVDA